MGGRRKAKVRVQKQQRETVAKVFNCPFCNHQSSVECKIDRDKQIGTVRCRVCDASYQATIHYLTDPIDVYSEWIDECEAQNKVSRVEAIVGSAAGGGGYEREREEKRAVRPAGAGARRPEAKRGVAARAPDYPDEEDEEELPAIPRGRDKGQAQGRDRHASVIAAAQRIAEREAALDEAFIAKEEEEERPPADADADADAFFGDEAAPPPEADEDEEMVVSRRRQTQQQQPQQSQQQQEGAGTLPSIKQEPLAAPAFAPAPAPAAAAAAVAPDRIVVKQEQAQAQGQVQVQDDGEGEGDGGEPSLKRRRVEGKEAAHVPGEGKEAAEPESSSSSEGEEEGGEEGGEGSDSDSDDDSDSSDGDDSASSSDEEEEEGGERKPKAPRRARDESEEAAELAADLDFLQPGADIDLDAPRASRSRAWKRKAPGAEPAYAAHRSKISEIADDED